MKKSVKFKQPAAEVAVKEESTAVAESRNIRANADPVAEAELSQVKDVQEAQVGILSRPFDSIGHNIDQILGEFRTPLLQRRELILN